MTVSDKQLSEFYKGNPQLFKHEERIRLSQILIACPEKDFGPIVSVRTQVLKANPELRGDELALAVKRLVERQRQKAAGILARAAAGENFANLGNKYSDDLTSRAQGTGGDMGYQEKAQILPELAPAIWPLKAGAVYPKLVRTALGFHIVKVTDRQSKGSIPFSQAKESIKLMLTAKGQEQALSNWLKTKRLTTPVVFSPQFARLLSPTAPP